MKTINRKTTVISELIEDLLNKQIGLEAKASANYLAAASWCDSRGYANCADFFYLQSDEERMHMLKIFHYLNDVGATAVSPRIEEVIEGFVSLRDVFEFSLESEIKVSEAINQIVLTAKDEKDYSTEQFMQWFVQEQREEEIVARRAVELFDLLGEDKLALFMIDERIQSIKKINSATPNTPA